MHVEPGEPLADAAGRQRDAGVRRPIEVSYPFWMAFASASRCPSRSSTQKRARESARLAACRNNLKQIGLALHEYEDVQRVYPPSSTSFVEEGVWKANPLDYHLHSWASLILPDLLCGGWMPSLLTTSLSSTQAQPVPRT